MGPEPLNYQPPASRPPRFGRLRRFFAPALRRVLWIVAGIGLVLVLLVLWFGVPMKTIEVIGELLSFAWSDPLSALYFGAPLTWGLMYPPGLAILVLTLLSGTLTATRRRDAAVLLGHVTAAIDLNVPLPVYLRLASRGEAPGPRRRLRRLVDGLEAGEPIHVALRDAAPGLPPRLLERVAAAERSHTLSPSLGPLLRQERRQLHGADPGRTGVAYALLLSGLVLGMMTLISWFVAPKFAQIFHDFKVPLPPITLTLFGHVPPPVASLVLIALLLAMLILLGRVTRELFFVPRRTGRLRPLWDRVAWRLPVFGRLTRARDCAAACTVLGEALRAGRPLPEAINTATLPSLNAVLRRRLAEWRTAVESGVAPASAARAARLPRLLCDLLAAARHDTADAVDFAGRVYAAAGDRVAVVLTALTPVLFTAVMSVVVLLVALGLFTPMVTLIDAIVTKVYP